MAKVLISIPTTGWIHKQTASVAMRLLADGRHDVKVIQPTHRPFENNLHHIRNQAVADGVNYWLSIDADNPPVKNPLDLVDLDLDLVGCPTPVWHYTGQPGERPIYWNAYQYVPDRAAYREWPTKTGLQEVDAIGTGCFLVSRRVLEALPGACFARPLHDDGTVERGNDIAFCERVKLAGFSIYAHYDYPCRHFVELDLCEVIEAHQRVAVRG